MSNEYFRALKNLEETETKIEKEIRSLPFEKELDYIAFNKNKIQVGVSHYSESDLEQFEKVLGKVKDIYTTLTYGKIYTWIR